MANCIIILFGVLRTVTVTKLLSTFKLFRYLLLVIYLPLVYCLNKSIISTIVYVLNVIIQVTANILLSKHCFELVNKK